MKIEFFKYQGTGNDFIIFDGRAADFPIESFDPGVVQSICHRRFGIGADGVIILRPSRDFDFYMHYYNSDGHPGSMCGNGSRCLVDLAHRLGHIEEITAFEASDGPHKAHVEPGKIAVLMNAGEPRSLSPHEYFIDTGSPHFIRYVDRIDDVDVVEEGRRVRNSPEYREEGVNVNFIHEISPEEIEIATYERGVEDETLSCGTGVTAAALIHMHRHNKAHGIIHIRAKGGNLDVEVKRSAGGSQEAWLIGPATMVYKGVIDIVTNSN